MNPRTMIDIAHCCKKLVMAHSMLDADADETINVAIPLCDLMERLAREYTNLNNILMKYGRNLPSVLKEIQRDYSHRLHGWSFAFTSLWELQQTDDVNLDKGVYSYQHYHGDTTMIVVYPYTSHGYVLTSQQKQQKHLVEVNKQRLNRLTMEMTNLYKSLLPGSDTLKAHRYIEDILQSILGIYWPNKGYRVARFGSSASELLLDGSDLDLCVVSPLDQQLMDGQRSGRRGNFGWSRRYGNDRNSIFDLYNLKEVLETELKVRVEAIESAVVPLCKFIDPWTGTACDLTIHNTLAMENSKLIKEYTLLDPRIRPLVYMLKHFTKRRSINDSRGGTLSSYAYNLMCLHYLMNIPNPVIPNLQYIPGDCSSANCKAKLYPHGKHLRNFLYRDKVTAFDVFFHDCIQVIPPNKRQNQSFYSPHATHWHSRNSSSLAALLIGFFDYYTSFDVHRQTVAFTPRSKKNGKNKHRKDVLVVYDPFIEDRNVTKSCTTMGWERIQREFQRASNMMKNGASFGDVCVKLNLPQYYYDPDSLNARLKK